MVPTTASLAYSCVSQGVFIVNGDDVGPDSITQSTFRFTLILAAIGTLYIAFGFVSENLGATLKLIRPTPAHPNREENSINDLYTEVFVTRDVLLDTVCASRSPLNSFFSTSARMLRLWHPALCQSNGEEGDARLLRFPLHQQRRKALREGCCWRITW